MALLGISEAQLIHCRVGKDNVQRLVSKPIDILQDLTTIGKAIGSLVISTLLVFKRVHTITQNLVTTVGYF